MKMDQIAFYCSTEEAEVKVKEQFGLIRADDWVKDTVVANNWVKDLGYGVTSGWLQFNYSLGIELEILRYIDGRCWHDRDQRSNGQLFISHIGVHLDDDEEFGHLAHPASALVQTTRTLSHSNAYVNENNRFYEFQIYQLGTGYIKYIKRRTRNAEER